VAHNSPSATGVDPVSKTRHLSVVLSEDERRSRLLLYVTSETRHEGLRHQAVAHNRPSATGVDPVSKTRHFSVVLSEDERRSRLLLYVTSGTRHEGLRHQAVAHNRPSATGVDPVSKTRHLSVVLSEDEKRSGLLLYVTSETRHEGLRQQVTASPAVTLTQGKYKRQNNTKTRYNELHTLYDELDIDKVIKTGRLKWLGHIFRMRDLDPSRRLTVLK